MEKRRFDIRAFSLMEVVIALGIFSTALVLLVGVLPQNLDRMRKSSSLSMERRIAENIVGELMLAEWGEMHLQGAKDNRYRYYDAQGIELRDFSDNAIFTARLKVLPRDVNLDQDRSLEALEVSDEQNHDLPDDKNVGRSTSQHSRRVIVEITDVVRDDFDFDDPENKPMIYRVGTVVANFSDLDL